MIRLVARGAAVALAAALFGAAAADTPIPPKVAIGVELPLAGDDGWRGLAARGAVDLAVAQWNADRTAPMRVAIVFADSSEHIANPHEDEGTDNLAQGANGARIVAGFVRNPRVVAVIGGLRQDIADAEAPTAARASIALLSQAATPVAPPAGKKSTLFRVTTTDETEGRLLATLGRADGYRSVAVDSRDPVRATAIAAAIGSLRARVATRSDATLFVGPSTRGCVLAPPVAAAALRADDLLRYMERRGYEPFRTTVAYTTIEPTLVLDPVRGPAFRAQYLAQTAQAPSTDADAYYVATQVALRAIADVVASGAPMTRTNVVAAIRARTFATVAGALKFTPAGGADRGCYAVTRIPPRGEIPAGVTRCAPAH
ncbi:MAG: hypothetical protein ACREM6_02590 [Vulcanimicrobiaceae bacterium]